MAWAGLRIGLFESHSHFLSIAKPRRPQIPQGNPKKNKVSKKRNMRKIGNPPGSASMGGAPLIIILIVTRITLNREGDSLKLLQLD